MASARLGFPIDHTTQRRPSRPQRHHAGHLGAVSNPPTLRPAGPYAKKKNHTASRTISVPTTMMVGVAARAFFWE